MAYQFATIIVPAAAVADMRTTSKAMHTECDGMFVSALSATGRLPATHFISSGYMPTAYFNMMINAAHRANFRAANGLPFPHPHITNVLATCDVSIEPPFVAMARMGLQIANPAVP